MRDSTPVNPARSSQTHPGLQRRARRHALALAMAALASPHAFANNAPVPFDGWSVAGGVVDTTASCSMDGVRCVTLVEDDGFIQQEVTTSHGRYYRTIITGAGASGTAADLPFASENFVPVGANPGFTIRDKQVIRDVPSGFESSSLIERSPFTDRHGHEIDLFNMELNQSLNVDGFANDFRLAKYSASGEPDIGPVSGRILDIHQEVRLNGPDDPFPGQQSFDHRQRGGWKTENVDDTLRLTPLTTAGSLTLGDNTLAWEEGDELRSTRISQTDAGGEIGDFGFQEITRRSADTGQVTSVRIVSFEPPPPTDPFDWDDAHDDAASVQSDDADDASGGAGDSHHKANHVHKDKHDTHDQGHAHSG